MQDYLDILLQKPDTSRPNVGSGASPTLHTSLDTGSAPVIMTITHERSLISALRQRELALTSSALPSFIMSVLLSLFHSLPLASTEQDSDAPTRPASTVSVSTAKLSKSQSTDSRVSGTPSTERKGSKTPTSDTECKSGVSYSASNFSLGSRDDTGSLDTGMDVADGPEINEVNVVFVKYPDECCPACCTRRSHCCERIDKTSCGQTFWSYRCYMYKLVEHRYFETFIIIMICASSLSLVS